MPQINLEELLEHYGAEVSCEMVDIFRLYSTQSQINADKTADILTSSLQYGKNPCNETTPIVITKANSNGTSHVIDGHHRASACVLYQKTVAQQKGHFKIDTRMRVLRLQQDIRTSLKMSKKLPGNKSHRF